MFDRLSNLRGLGPTEILWLGQWKIRQHAQTVWDRTYGGHLLRKRRDRYVRQFLSVLSAGGIRSWLERPGAGVWWFGPTTPESWASGSTSAADIAVADAAVEGKLRILGAETRASPTIEWRRDLYSGNEWHLDPSSTLVTIRTDGSDIRTVWELSRCYHFALLGKAWAHTGEARYADTFVKHVRSFIRQNPIGLGPHWASPMDVALRAANWCLAVYLFRAAPLSSMFWAEILADLRVAGEWVERHLEWHPRYRGNHYVADLVGLLYAGTLFHAEPWGRKWLDFTSYAIPRELDYQVRPDGVAFEASLGYHRLHTELFTFAGELLRENTETFPQQRFDERLTKMVGFIGTYLQPDGSAPLIGDADDGRLHTLSAEAHLEPRRHAIGLPSRWPVVPPGDGAFAFPDGGFFVLRSGDDQAVIRCGPVGINGAGSHDHCDQLSFDLVVSGIPLVTDSGTYAYTRDLSARHRFRSTSAHSVIQIGGEEQNPISPERPWRILEDRTRARALHVADETDSIVFTGEHFGYSDRPSRAVCRRTVRRERSTAVWHINDEIDGSGTEAVVWRLHLATEGVRINSGTGWSSATVELGPAQTAVIEIHHPPQLRLRLDQGAASVAYGHQFSRPVLVLEGAVGLPCALHCSIHVPFNAA